MEMPRGQKSYSPGNTNAANDGCRRWGPKNRCNKDRQCHSCEQKTVAEFCVSGHLGKLYSLACTLLICPPPGDVLVRVGDKSCELPKVCENIAMITPQEILELIRRRLPPQCSSLLDERDGAFRVVKHLQACVDPSETKEGQCEVWDGCASFYVAQGRFHEALVIYHAMYAKLMDTQTTRDERKHKGTPLVRISEIHGYMGHPLLAKRYIMLTLCEDAIGAGGRIPINETGSYFRAVWQHGIPDHEFHRYASDAWNASQLDAQAARFPEWALQEVDQKWMTEYASSAEASLYVANPSYCSWLLSKLGESEGRALERLAHYLLSCIPGFRAKMRMRTLSTDYDVYCAVEGPTYDFRSELGRYFVCECKDWDRAADVTTVQKLAGVLRAAKCRFGIIFSKKGISGRGDSRFADRELLKIKQEGIIILTITEADLKEVVGGANFFSMLRDLYEREHLDLQSNVEKHRERGKKDK